MHFVVPKKLEKYVDYIWITALYWLTHVIALTKLPVFADESIYIRWAQLIQDDPTRYAFLSMLDGKPPLYIWMLSIVLRLFPDPLLVGRAFSLLVGFLMLFVMRGLVREWTTKKLPIVLVTIAGTLLPFWFFSSRMALMDELLTFLIGIAILATLKICFSFQKNEKVSWQWVLTLVASFGGALMTKTPALFAIPAIAMTPVFFWIFQPKANQKMQQLTRMLLWVGIGGVGGCLIFLSLRLTPLFGSLFSRSSDFTFSISQILSGEWRFVILHNIPRFFVWMNAYLSPLWIVAVAAGLLYKKSRIPVLYFSLCGILFAGPLIVLGKILWPRYILPSAFFFTVASVYGVQSILEDWKYKTFGYLLLAFALLACWRFIWPSYTNLAAIPFVIEDQSQYLTDWPAGFGNAEVRDFIRERAAVLPSDKRIYVLTEGSFGTLPDGLLMYFHHDPILERVEIDGIGVSVGVIPPQYVEAAKTNEVYYVVNSHRFGLHDPLTVEEIFAVPRPLSGPSLMLYKVLPGKSL